MSILVPPDDKCNSAFEQIAAIARSHALVVSAFGGVMTISTPDAQREEGIREKVLTSHCMVEITDNGEVYEPSPVAQWPARKMSHPVYRPKPKPQDNGIDLSAFEED